MTVEATATAAPVSRDSNIIARLRADADSWEQCGRALGYLDAEDERRNVERVACLREAADRLEELEKEEPGQ